MQSTLIKIGNSQGVIIPAQLLKQCQLDDVVSVEVRGKSIVISKPDQPRNGWQEAFKASARSDDKLLMDETVINDFDNGEWTW